MNKVYKYQRHEPNWCPHRGCLAARCAIMVFIRKTMNTMSIMSTMFIFLNLRAPGRPAAADCV